MKKLALISLLSIALSSTAMANTNAQTDMEKIFGSNANTVSASQLSNTEMNATEGKWLVPVVIWTVRAGIWYYSIKNVPKAYAPSR